MLTLAEYKVGLRDHIDQMVVDEFRRNSELLDLLMFDDAVAANGSGSTLAYGYQRLITPSGAATRTINNDYTANEAKRKDELTHLVIMGGLFEIDRVIAQTSGVNDEVQFQLKDKIKATSNLFHYLAVNGVEAKDSTTGSYTQFNGLSKLLEGADTEITSKVNVSAWTDDKTEAFALIDEVEEMIASMLVKPNALLMNRQMKVKLASAARRAGYLTKSESAFGTPIDAYNGIKLLDMGEYYDKTANMSKFAIPTTAGKTDIFAISTDRDGFIGVSTQGGSSLIASRLPDFSRPEAVQKGSVEMTAAVALKNTKKAAVLRGVQISAT